MEHPASLAIPERSDEGEAQHSDKVLILGLDGATFDLAKPWVRAGKLPTLARLMQEGTYGDLLSTIPAVSAVAWTTFATGKNPGKHGIFGFKKFDRHSYQLRFNCGADCQATTLWRLLSEEDRRVLVVNIPMTYPPEPVHGVLLSGMDAPGIDSDFTYPRAFKQELLQAVPDYVISLHLMGYLDSHKKRRQALQQLLREAEARAQTVLYLLEKYPWDFLAVRFNASDSVQHHFWKYMALEQDPRSAQDEPGGEQFREAVLQVYQKLDECLARILDQVDADTTVMVMSDHGAGPCEPKVVYINEWLRQQGFLALRTGTGNSGGGGRGTWWRRARRWLIDSSLRWAIRRLPHRTKDQLKRRLPEAVGKVAAQLRFGDLFDQIDWTRTRAYVAEGFSIRINLQGRDPQGIVQPGEEYETLVETLLQKLAELSDPETQERVFDQVCRREELYQGPYVEAAPDLILLRHDHTYRVASRFFRQPKDSVVVREQHWRRTSGRHRPNGIFILWGPKARQGVEITGSQIADVAPTVLHLMGFPVPDDMDGRVLTEALEEHWLRAHPVRCEEVGERRAGDESSPGEAPVYSEEEARRIEEHLAELGYLE